MTQPRRTGTGAGRLLVAVYALFVLAAGARAGVQLATKFDHAPLAYSLSAVAAAIYLFATLTLAAHGTRARHLAYLACTLELSGVVLVGTASLLLPRAFPDTTVWSHYGSGYAYVPTLLPLLALLRLRATRALP